MSDPTDKEFTEAECAAARRRMADVVRQVAHLLGADAPAEERAELAARVVVNRRHSDPAMYREVIRAGIESHVREYLDEKVAKGELVKVDDDTYERARR